MAGLKTAMPSLLVGLLCLLLVACGQSRVVRRDYHAGSGSPRVATARAGESIYTVRRGDTLYGIAFRSGLDFRDVAAWNHIGPPYTIYPGQRLRLRSAPVARTGKPPVQTRTSAPVATASTPRAVTAPPPARTAITAPPAKQGPAAAPKTPVVAPVAAAAPGNWLWPTSGQIIGRYVAGDPTRQGIDVAGSAGQPVLASADGVVVYSGTGLVGYGEVIIVKHSDEWLSAYGHNRRRLVAEGDTVKGGQAIAELGRSGTSRDMLHFEIRRNGKPVDPLSLLPKR